MASSANEFDLDFVYADFAEAEDETNQGNKAQAQVACCSKSGSDSTQDQTKGTEVQNKVACCSDTDFTEEQLRNLALYYKKLMPFAQLYEWFGYGKAETFAKREFSFTLSNDVYIRYRSFDTWEQLAAFIQKKRPTKIDIGGIYKTKPNTKALGLELTPTRKELVFDIDMSDYDDVRTCCSGAGICKKCWKFMAIASKIITIALKEDFDYDHVLWVFSGRRGIHGWVADKRATELKDEARAAVVDYLTLLKDGNSTKKVTLYERGIHTSIFTRALKIIDEYFLTIIAEQDLLGNNERLKKFLLIIDKNLRKQFQKSMKRVNGSVERWKAFENKFTELQEKEEIPKNLMYLREEITLQYTYPRLDVHVSRTIGHLLKAPFCVHPKTEKICVPFDVEQVDDFDPIKVPTISTVMEEINKFDQDQSEMLDIEDMLPLEEYQKTSLKEPIDLLKKFISNVEKDD